MGSLSRRDADRLLARLRRNHASLILAGGRLPTGRAWVETIETPGRLREPGAWRWQVVTPTGWANIGSRWPARLIINATEIHFRPTPEGLCAVEMTP